jgi:hypothetical protein
MCGASQSRNLYVLIGGVRNDKVVLKFVSEDEVRLVRRMKRVELTIMQETLHSRTTT